MLLSHLFGSPGDVGSSSIFIFSLWVAKNLEIEMFSTAYIKEGQSGLVRTDTEVYRAESQTEE